MNIRTSGTMTKEDMEMLERQQSYTGEGGTDLNFKPGVHLDGLSFEDDDPMVHSGGHAKEGDQHKSAPETACS